MPPNVGSTDWLGSSAQGSKAGSCPGQRIPRTSLSTNAGGSSEPFCRPWERGDLLRRLATFKPSNWCGKPKVCVQVCYWTNITTLSFKSMVI